MAFYCSLNLFPEGGFIYDEEQAICTGQNGKLSAKRTQAFGFFGENGGCTHCAGSVTLWGTHLGSEEYEPDAADPNILLERSFTLGRDATLQPSANLHETLQAGEKTGITDVLVNNQGF